MKVVVEVMFSVKRPYVGLQRREMTLMYADKILELRMLN